MKKVKEEIERMLQNHVIEPVDELTECCSPVVVVAKADGRVQICVDLTKLNQAVRREVYQIPTVEESLGSLAEGSLFSKLEANSEIVLNPESAKLTLPSLRLSADISSSVCLSDIISPRTF